VLLGSSFTGGEFIIDGEVCPLAVDREQGKLPIVAFHTDTLHEVRPVASGVRVSLQFDVFRTEQPDSDGEFDEEFGKLNKWMVDTDNTTSSMQLVDETKCGIVVAQVKDRLRTTKHLILPAFHRYTQYALQMGNLKPIDDCLARKLREQGCAVTPVPLNLVEETYGSEDPEGNYNARIFWKGPFGEGKPQSAPAGAEFVVLPRMEGTHLYSREYLEFTGNESQSAIFAYHLAGFLISAPDAEDEALTRRRRK
jgi:hypothetical protein